MCPWPNPCPIAVIRGRKSPFDTDTRFRGLFSNYQRPSTWRNCLIKAPMRRYLRGLYYPFIMLRRNLWRSTSSEIEEATLLAVAAIACVRRACGCVWPAPREKLHRCEHTIVPRQPFNGLSFGSIIIIIIRCKCGFWFWSNGWQARLYVFMAVYMYIPRFVFAVFEFVAAGWEKKRMFPFSKLDREHSKIIRWSLRSSITRYEITIPFAIPRTNRTRFIYFISSLEILKMWSDRICFHRRWNNQSNDIIN